MPRISRDERSCAFVQEFMEYVTHYDELHQDNELDQDSFIVQMDKVLHKAAHLEPAYLANAITLVDSELKKHKLFKKLAPLLKLYNFLQRVLQSERDYFAMLKTEERERDELTSKHDKQRQDEHKKIEMINDAIELLRDQIEDFKELKDELKQKRKASVLQREEECEQLRKRQRGD